MATNPLHKFTVAESNNLQVYENYASEQLTCADNDTYDESADWAGGSDGRAKQVVIVPYTGDAAGVVTLQLKINGSYGDPIVLLFNDYPLTIDNLLIDQLKIKTADSTTDEIFTVLSFH